MAGGRKDAIPALITSARIGKSLDADQRNRRYLASMAVRVACFLAACFTPFPYNAALILGAAIIPGLAVILANAVDKRTTPQTVASGAPAGTPALTQGVVVTGVVDEGDGS